jgi:hypothetical protein
MVRNEKSEKTEMRGVERGYRESEWDWIEGKLKIEKEKERQI